MKFQQRSRSWYSVKRVRAAVTAIGEFKHDEEVLSYVIEGAGEALVIDSGTGMADIRAAIRRVTKKPLILVNTHEHWDHVGGNSQFDRVLKVANGDRIRIAPFTFEVISTPGHSSDSCVFFERKRGWLFSGDTVYFGPIFITGPDADLGDYKRSLRAIRRLKARTVFPGHNSYMCSPGLVDRLYHAVRPLRTPANAYIPICGRLRIKVASD